MKIISPLAEKTLKEILDNRDEKGNCNTSYWEKKFELISGAEEDILRSTFKELREADMVSTMWAENYPYYLTVLAKGITYFDEKESLHEQAGATYINNFYESVQDIQIQQGTHSSTQMQENKHSFSEEAIKELINTIKRYDVVLDDEYGSEGARKLRSYTKELIEAIEEQKSESHVRKIISCIKDISVSARGSLVATGIFELTSALLV